MHYSGCLLSLLNDECYLLNAKPHNNVLKFVVQTRSHTAAAC